MSRRNRVKRQDILPASSLTFATPVTFTSALKRGFMPSVDLVDDVLASDLYCASGLVAKAIDVTAEEMTRAGFDLDGVDEGVEEKIETALESIRAMDLLADGLRWNFLFGGSLILMLIDDGGSLQDPLNFDNIRTLSKLRVYDKTSVQIASKYANPAYEKYGETAFYRIQSNGSPSFLVHESRCLVFDGLPVPDQQRQTNQGWGGSLLQRFYSQYLRTDSAHKFAAQLVERSQQGVHKINGLSQQMMQPGGKAGVQNRLRGLDETRSIENTIAIDGLDGYDVIAKGASGISDLLDHFDSHLAAASGVPQTVLFGKQQSGLNGTASGELQFWYAKIEQLQSSILSPILDRLVSIQMKALGVYTENYKLEFEPLSVPSDLEENQTKKAEADTWAVYVNTGIMTANEVREEKGLAPMALAQGTDDGQEDPELT